ncbi:MAG: 7TM diverse intracellular signaling domain-containing protein [Bacteroidota bacterium]
MKLKGIRTATAGIVLAIGLLGCERNRVEVQDAVLDLSDWDGKSVDLNGNWLLYWDTFYHPSLQAHEGLGYEMARSWNSLDDSLGQRAFGKAVYYLQLIGIQHQQLGLRIPYRAFCSYRLIVNGEEVWRVGQTGFDEPYAPDMKNQLIPLTPGLEEMEIFIEVANFSQRRGGLLAAPRLGILGRMFEERQSALIPEMVVITIVLVIALFGFNYYWLDRDYKMHLYLALLAMLSVIRQLAVDEVILKLLWPDAPYWLFEIMRHSGLWLSLGLAARFISYLFDQDANLTMTKALEYIFIGLALAIPITPVWLNSYISLIAQPLSLWLLGYAVYLGIRHRTKYPKVGLLVLGLLAVIIAFGHDVLVANMIVYGAYWQSYGVSLFIVCYAAYVNSSAQAIQARHKALSKQLSELSVISDEKKVLDLKVADTLKKVRPNLGDPERKKADELIHEIQQHHHVSERQEVLQQTIANSNEQFVQSLRRRFPTLTRGEEEMCLMFRAKMTTKEIAQRRKITVESAKVARKRLRKKLGLPPKEDIYKFLESI